MTDKVTACPDRFWRDVADRLSILMRHTEGAMLSGTKTEGRFQIQTDLVRNCFENLDEVHSRQQGKFKSARF